MIELLITLTISIVVLGGVIALFSLSVIHSRKTIEAGRLDKTLHRVLDTIGRDIQRAGYWGQAETGSNNPFMVTGSTDIQVNAANNCILLTYDSDSNGTLPTISASIDDERYGFRLLNNAIQYRPRGAPLDCTAASTSWTDFTDPNTITITQFTVTLTTDTLNLGGTETISVRSVNLSVTGSLVSEPAVSTTLTKRIRVYNDKYSP